MKAQNSVKVKFGVWGLMAGAVIAIILGFAWAGWTTQSSAQKMSDEAVLASHSAICVAQFMKEPNHQERLKEFAKIDSWKRSEFIEKGGWDKMPGQEKAGYSVAQACAKGLEALIKK